MAITFDNSGKPTYMFQAGATSTDGIWYAVGAKIDTAAGYEWGGTNTFLNTVTTDATVNMRDGFNNFLNPAARDAALTSPAHGTLAFVRQDAGGNTINQIQFYNGSAWVANDGDINGVTAGTGLSGGGTSGTVTLSVDTTVVATTNNTLTMTNKTLTSPVISTISNTGTLTLPTSTDTLVGRATTDTLTNKTLTSPTITTPTLTLASTSSTTSGRISFDASVDKLYVGDGTNAVEFASSTLITNAQTGTTYTFTLTDKDKLITASTSATQTYSIPTNATTAFPVGTQINIIQIGAGQVTIQAASSGTTTVSSTGATSTAPKLRAQYSSATLIKAGTDLWYVVGDIS